MWQDRFEALQARLVPRWNELTPAQKAESRRLVTGFVAGLAPALRLQIMVFLVAVDGLALLTGGRVFRGLAPPRQERLLRWLFDSPVKKVRIGFWGVNTLAKLGVYGQQSVHPAIGYRLREVRRV